MKESGAERCSPENGRQKIPIMDNCCGTNYLNRMYEKSASTIPLVVSYYLFIACAALLGKGKRIKFA
jgi:hypothetical protein